MPKYSSKIFLCVFLTIQFYSVAQINTDSLFKVWNDPSRPDTLRMQAMQRICLRGYLYSKPDTAFILANELYDFAVKKKHDSYTMFALQVMGSSCSIRADYERSIEYFTQSLKMAEEQNDYKNISSSLNNIGVIYYEQGQSQKAIDYYSRSLAISEKFNKKSGIARALGNLGTVYQSLGQNQKAIEAQTRCLKIAEEMNDDNARAGVMAILGAAYGKLNQPEKGIEILKKALEISKKEGLAITAREASQNLYFVYKKQGKNAEALAMHEYYILMRDSIQNEKNQGKMLQQEMQYNYDKQKALDKKDQEKKLAVSAANEQKQKIITYSIFAGLVLVMLFALFVFNRLRITRKQKAIIESQKELVEEKQKEIIDSIRYAKRIQQSLLPSEKYIARNLKDLNKNT